MERPLGRPRDDGLWREYQDALGAARSRRDEQRAALSSRADEARAAHRRQFKLRHHAIAAMPIPGRDRRKLYKTLSFERETAKRRLTAKIKGWRAASVHGHPGSWKEFLATLAARGDQRAIRRLARNSERSVIKSRDKQVQAMLSRSSRTSRGSIVHNLPGGVRLRESAGSIELLGDARDEALEQLARFAKQRFGSKYVRLLGRKDARWRLAKIAADRGLEISQDRER